MTDDAARLDNPPISHDPRLILRVARSFASALELEAIRNAVAGEMARFYPAESWFLHIAGEPDPGAAHGALPPHQSAENRQDIPILWGGQCMGSIEVVAGRNLALPPAPPGFLNLIADFAGIALHNAHQISRMRALTILDDCTGLYNSRHLVPMLVTEIERSRRFHLPFSVLFVDLDYFKRVNDAHGHMAGSWLLARVAGTIRDSIRGIDSAFRYGGDEFVVLLPQTGKEPALEVGVRLLRSFRRSRYLYAHSISLATRASIGLAAYPEDGGSAEELIRAADSAMYRVKKASRDNISSAGSGCLLEAGE